MTPLVIQLWLCAKYVLFGIDAHALVENENLESFSTEYSDGRSFCTSMCSTTQIGDSNNSTETVLWRLFASVPSSRPITLAC